MQRPTPQQQQTLEMAAWLQSCDFPITVGIIAKHVSATRAEEDGIFEDLVELHLKGYLDDVDGQLEEFRLTPRAEQLLKALINHTAPEEPLQEDRNDDHD